MEEIQLRHLTGPRAGEVEVIPLADYRDLVLGREGDTVVRLHPGRRDEMNRWHARIIPLLGEPIRFVLVDVDNRKGTLVNRRPVPEAIPLRQGDVIRLGENGPEVEFRFHAADG